MEIEMQGMDAATGSSEKQEGKKHWRMALTRQT
jgi:hypothetical protein